MSAPQEFVHATNKLNVTNPFRVYGAVTAFGGALVAVVGGLPIFRRLADGDIAALADQGVGPTTLATLVAVVIGGITVLVGLTYFGEGLRSMVRLWVPPGTPKGFVRGGGVAESIRKRQLSAYDAPDVAKLWTVRQIMGDRVLLLSPRLRRTAVSLLREARSVLWPIGLVIVAFLVPAAAIEDRVLRYLWTRLRDDYALMLLVVLLIGAAIRIVAAFLLVPHRVPETLSHRRNQHVDGAGHPATLLSTLQETARFLERNGLPIRVEKDDPTLHGTGVGDTGTFKSAMLIEDQPKPLQGEATLAPAHLLAVTGTILLVIGVVILSLVQAPTRALVLPRDFLIVIRASGTLVVALVVITMGRRLLRHARAIYSGFRFNSKLFLLDIEGTFSRAQVTVGKAVMDSIESQNLVVRSEFSIVYHAAEATSETVALDAPRELLELRATPDVLADVTRLEAAVTALQSKGARPVAIDLGDPATHDIVRANVTISSMRRGRPSATELPADAPQSLLPPRTPVPLASTTDDTKVCPECAETVKALAKKCRFCGHRFNGTAG